MAILKWSEPIKDITKWSSTLSGVYLWESLVWPAWKPWANTVAYYPLKTDFNDASGNSRNLTNTNTSISTQSWVDCVYFNGSNSYLTYSWYELWNTARTINLWCYDVRPNSSSDNQWIIHIWNTALNMWLWWSLWLQFTNATTLRTSDWQNSSSESQTTTISLWWNNIVVTQQTTTVKLYLNWVLKFTITNYPSQTNAPNWWRLWASCRTNPWQYLKWYLSNVVLENKVRTAQEIADYYNQTKSNYWL